MHNQVKLGLDERFHSTIIVLNGHYDASSVLVLLHVVDFDLALSVVVSTDLDDARKSLRLSQFFGR